MNNQQANTSEHKRTNKQANKQTSKQDQNQVDCCVELVFCAFMWSQVHGEHAAAAEGGVSDDSDSSSRTNV